jgi:2-polyprenyl-3-methyl-5-hydroxy-6-metoxy-1,4-benzoquinol methylase
MKEFWDNRYAETEFAYGSEANKFLKEELIKIPKGKILFPADGEGRNSVFAATLGWEVTSFDISHEGQKKALQLAKNKQVKIEYFVEDLEKIGFKNDQFDVIALIFAHFPSNIKSHYHQLLSTYLKKGGKVIFEAFSKKHIDYNTKNEKVGGPKDIDTLFSKEEIVNDFKEFEIIELSEKEVELNEGKYHIGKGSVIRFVGKKI